MKFYGTFMQKQATKNKYVTIEAEEMGLAREAMFAHFGEKFMTVYSADDFAGQAERFGLSELLNLRVVDHGHGSLEYQMGA